MGFTPVSLETYKGIFPDYSLTALAVAIVAAKAINRIESDPTWKWRAINAAKGGGLAAFEKAIDNPAGAFVVGAIQGWQQEQDS